MKPKIVELPQFHVVGVCVYGNAESGVFPKCWDIYWSMYRKAPTSAKWKNDKVGYGLEFYTEEFEKENKWFYMACGAVENLSNIPTNMVGKVIPAHSYAVFTSKGKISELGKTFRYAYHEWLPTADYKIADCYDFEYYDERFRGVDDPASEVDVYIPITRKQVG